MKKEHQNCRDYMKDPMAIYYCPICCRELIYSFENQIESWYCNNCYNNYYKDIKKNTY